MYEFGFANPCTFLFQARAPFWWATQTQGDQEQDRADAQPVEHLQEIDIDHEPSCVRSQSCV